LFVRGNPEEKRICVITNRNAILLNKKFLLPETLRLYLIVVAKPVLRQHLHLKLVENHPKSKDYAQMSEAFGSTLLKKPPSRVALPCRLKSCNCLKSIKPNELYSASTDDRFLRLLISMCVQTAAKYKQRSGGS
jgi:hypothetical protein